MEHGSLLSHFSLKLGEAEKLDNVSGEVENAAFTPQCPDDFLIYSSKGAGKPVIFPATWCPPWSTLLNSITPLEGIANLLGNEIEVDAFTLQYGAPSIAVREAFSRHSKRRKVEHNQTANVCPNPLQDLKLLPPTLARAETPEARVPSHLSNIPLAPHWPIPRSSERRYRLGDFLKEAAVRNNERSTDSLLYLTWRGLPSPSSAAKSTSIKLTRFIDTCVEPAIAPHFMEAKRIKQRNLWIGNSVTSQLHFDGLDNLHVCIQGKKTFHLYPPCDTPNLYPHAWAEGASEVTSSTVDDDVRALFQQSGMRYLLRIISSSFPQSTKSPPNSSVMIQRSFARLVHHQRNLLLLLHLLLLLLFFFVFFFLCSYFRLSWCRQFE